MKDSLFIPFCIALFLCLFGTIFFPDIRFVPFAPFLVMVFQRKPFLQSLWAAALCGLVIDLLNTDIYFGLFSFVYLAVAALSYRWKKYFFVENLLALSFYSALISFLFSWIQMGVMAVFRHSLPFNWHVFSINFLCMPLWDVLYAFIWFSFWLFCSILFKRKQRRRPF